jgi:hypothetical protein
VLTAASLYQQKSIVMLNTQANKQTVKSRFISMKNIFSKQYLLSISEELGAWAFTGGIIFCIVWIGGIIF